MSKKKLLRSPIRLIMTWATSCTVAGFLAYWMVQLLPYPELAEARASAVVISILLTTIAFREPIRDFLLIESLLAESKKIQSGSVSFSNLETSTDAVKIPIRRFSESTMLNKYYQMKFLHNDTDEAHKGLESSELMTIFGTIAVGFGEVLIFTSQTTEGDAGLYAEAFRFSLFAMPMIYFISRFWLPICLLRKRNDTALGKI